MISRAFSDGLAWRKSSRSADQGGTCLYALVSEDHTGIRDSKEGCDGPILITPKTEWSDLLEAIKSGELDR